MPFHVNVIESGRLVVVQATGPADPQDWFDLAGHPDLPAVPAKDWRLLVDISPRETLPTVPQTWEIAERFADLADGRFSAVAVVATPGVQYGMTRMAEMVSEMRGLNVGVFTQVDEARSWLDQETKPDP